MEPEHLICSSCGRKLPWTKYQAVCRCGQANESSIDTSCIHRGNRIGVADCGCSGKPSVHWCNLLQGHCTIHATGKPWRKTTEGVERVGSVYPCVVCERRNEFTVYDQPVEPPTSDKLVVTIAIGKEFQDILDLTRPSLMAYAARIGADYREITDGPKYEMWQHEKFRIHQYAKTYRRTIFADADLLIRDSCPNLFDLVPEDSIGIHDDMNFNSNLDWLPPERDLVGKTQGVAILGDRCLNSGLIVHSRQHADIWCQPPKMLPKTHCSEQIWIEHQINQMDAKVFPLEPTFNMQWWWGDYYKEHRDAAHIVHLSGCRTNKLDLMRELVAVPV